MKDALEKNIDRREGCRRRLDTIVTVIEPLLALWQPETAGVDISFVNVYLGEIF